MNWWSRARCRDMAVNEFADDEGWARIRAAKTLCNGCPVRNQCLADAMSRGESWGVWGGFTTGERDRLSLKDARGERMYPIRQCPNCGLDFVYQRCYTCTSDRSGIQDVLEAHRARIATYYEKGVSDSVIASSFSRMLAVTVTRKDIREFRYRFGLTNTADAGPDTYDPANVERVEINMSGFAELTTRERVALMRRWLARGGTASSFSREFRVSGSAVRHLVRKARDLDWMTLLS